MTRTVHKIGSTTHTSCGLPWRQSTDGAGRPQPTGWVPLEERKRDEVKSLGALVTCPACLRIMDALGIPLDKEQRNRLLA